MRELQALRAGHEAAVLDFELANRAYFTESISDRGDDHGLRRLRAATSDANIASQRVLEKAGFVRTGPAEPAEIGGRGGWWYELALG